MLFTFYLLVIFHLLGDFVAQPNIVAAKKRGVNQEMIIHGIITTIAFLVPLLGYPLGKSLLGAVVIFIFHIIIDVLRAEIHLFFGIKPDRYFFWALLGFEQILHITVIFFTFQFLFY